MNIFIYLLVFSLLFTSCVSKTSIENNYNKDFKNINNIAYTSYGYTTSNNNLKLVVSAIYLNPLYKEFKNNKEEFFLISSYYLNGENKDILAEGFDFFLDGQKTLKIDKIKTNNKFIRSLNSNNWFNYYIVSFSKNKNKNKNKLQITNSREEISLKF